jgi:asparagine synthase (glutamine-hydrolysing)
MTDAIRRRGPDERGFWADAAAGVALGHRRLSIIDLSAAGAQPMQSHCGRYVISFNGEIYSYGSVRSELEKCASTPLAWRGHSDTEVALEAVREWGLDVALRKLVGMFAFALWDRKERILSLCRDRIGEKPLYYGMMGGALVFGSQLSALKAFPGFSADIDRGALSLMLRYSYIPAPFSIYRGVSKLVQGTYLRLSEADLRSGHLPAPTAYWSPSDVARSGEAAEFAGSDAEAVEELDRLLTEAVAGQMIADVPLGAFISGGIDSSTVVALMQKLSKRPVRTFSIGFHERKYDEAQYAKAVAQHLGTDHTELYVTAQEALDVIPQLPCIYDEPFSDSSQIPTHLVSKLARQHVTVALSGDAGDELFCGYNHYATVARLWRSIHRVPRALRRAVTGSLRAVPLAVLNAATAPLAPFLDQQFRGGNLAERLHKLGDVIDVDSPDQLFRLVVSHWKTPSDVVLGGPEPLTRICDPAQSVPLRHFENRMMYMDLVHYLADGILVKVDRAAMAVSLETRVPLLDHRVVEFAWRLPLHMKVRGGQRKWVLRQLLYRYVPQRLVERPKMGFGVPIAEWLRGPLREWADNLLRPARLRAEGYLRPEPIAKCWQEHLQGKRDWAYYLWDVLMFQAWLEART